MKKIYHLTIIIINVALFLLGIVLIAIPFGNFQLPIKDTYIYLLGVILIINACYTTTEAVYNIINEK